jgi:hypothetical protein
MNFWGVPGDMLSFLTQILAMVLTFIIGLAGYRGSLLRAAAYVGIPANTLAQLIFAGGGPGVCLGLVALPLWCFATGYMGRGLWWLLWGRNQHPPACENCGALLLNEFSSFCGACGKPARCRFCGYNLAGNTSGRCPECGRLLADATEPDNDSAS